MDMNRNISNSDNSNSGKYNLDMKERSPKESLDNFRRYHPVLYDAMTITYNSESTEGKVIC